ncbi:hypothetical protein T484DRAFT_1799882, partial [Baffinella frigidus]
MIMAAGKIPYEEKLINGAAFKALKDGGKCPFDQLPVMEIGTDGTVLADSGAICRYLAKMGGLYPSDPIQAALSEEAFEVSQGCASINPIVNVFKDDVFAEKKAEYFTSFAKKKKAEYFTSFAKKVGLLPKRLGEKIFFAGDGPTLGDVGLLSKRPGEKKFSAGVGLLSKRLGEKKFFAGVGPTLGDFGVMHVLDMSLLLEPTSLDTAENLKAFVARMREPTSLDTAENLKAFVARMLE